jgi:MOSC domain-containing protein YiiM
MAHLVSIAYSPEEGEVRPADHYARVPVERTTLVEKQGITGDRKGGGKRQLNVMRAEALEELHAEGFKTAPGEMGEQLVIAGLAPSALAAGTRLRIGETAVIEVNIPRTGCGRFEHIQGKSKKLTVGRLGALATVHAGGEIAVGDEVIVVPAD